jgi:hypothetical protein
MFKYFKRRWTDIGIMLKGLWSELTLFNSIFYFPGAIFLSLFMIFLMQFEDYDLIDSCEEEMEWYWKNVKKGKL